MDPDMQDPKVPRPGASIPDAAPTGRKAPDDGQKALRTLEGDIAEAVAERNASMASISMAAQAEDERHAAEAAKAEKAYSSNPPSKGNNGSKKAAIVGASILLIIVGIGGAYFLYEKSPLAATAPPAPAAPAKAPSIVPADSQEGLDVTGLGASALRAKLESAFVQAGQPGTIAQIVPVTKGSSGESIMDSSDFLTAAGIAAPDILARSLNQGWMMGTYADGTTSAPFIILSENFFQNAYAGMISWEKTLPDDLAGLVVNGQAIASSSGPLSSYFSINGAWSDGVIENKDVRLFTAPDGTLLLLYSFVDNDTIVITSDENALAEIIRRLENQGYTS